MKTCYLVIALLSVVAALVMSAEQTQECRCDEGSKASLTVLKNSNLAKGVCGHLTLDSCNLTILCDSNSSLTLVSGESLELDCSSNVTNGLRVSDNRIHFTAHGDQYKYCIDQTLIDQTRNIGAPSTNSLYKSVDVIFECSGDTKAHLKEGTSNNPVLRILYVCANNSNETSLTTAYTESPTTTNKVGTTESTKNPTPETGTTNKPTVTTDNPQYSDYSNTTRSSNSSLDTTEVIPSGNITTAEIIPSGNTTATSTRAPETTTGYAVSFRVCSGLVVMMLAVSSLL